MTRIGWRCDWLAVWILWSAWCSLAGWALSAAGLLDRTGYVIATLLFVVLLAWKRRLVQVRSARPPWLLRRSTYARRLLPKLWLAGVVLITLGGLLYHPDNLDYLTYRFPRLLQWCWLHHWTWIDTVDQRQNYSAVGMEWLMAPLVVLFRSDRLFFLINLVSYLFLPGLTFSVLRQLGVGRRMAWNWMWLLPFGYSFLLQAGSMANDTYVAVPFLAALYYAGRARADAPVFPALSIISIALVTGEKASNIPLVLPWLTVVWLNRRGFFGGAKPVVLAAACAIGLACSFLPIGVINILHTGSYTGDPQNLFQLQPKTPFAALVGNGMEIASSSLEPPFWPHPLAFDLLPNGVDAWVKRNFERYELNSVPFQIEDNAGLGLGVTAMTVLSIVAGLRARAKRIAPARKPGAVLFAVATALACAGYMGALGSEAGPRLFAVFYVAAIAALLALWPDDGRLPRTPWWQGLAALAMLMGVPLLILNPARPLLPLGPLTRLASALHLAPAVVQLQDNHELRVTRRDFLRPLRLAIPASERQVEIVEGPSDPETSAWLPLGSRQIVRGHVEQTGALSGHYVIVSGRVLDKIEHVALADLLRQNSLRVVETESGIAFKTKRKPQTWYLLAPATPAP